MAPPTRRVAQRVAQRNDEETDETETTEQTFVGDFFQYSSWTLYVLVLAGVTLFWMLFFHPDLIPYHLLGPLGNILISIKENYRKTVITGLRVLVLIHSIEAFATYRLCRRMKFTMKTTMMWTLQSFFLGFASYGVILKYSADRNNFLKEKDKQS